MGTKNDRLVFEPGVDPARVTLHEAALWTMERYQSQIAARDNYLAMATTNDQNAHESWLQFLRHRDALAELGFADTVAELEMMKEAAPQ